MKIHPYLRWLGGKYHIIKHLINMMPKESIDAFVEPFCGTGIVYAFMWNLGIVKNGLLNDYGKWVILCHKLVRDKLDYYLSEAEKYRKLIEGANKDADTFKNMYLKVRAEFNANINDTSDEQLMRFIFLSKLGFNGLIRFNKNGLSNTSPGHHNLKFIVDTENMKAISNAFKNAEFSIGDFNTFLDSIKNRVGRNSMIFYDPPYLPTFFDETKKDVPFGNYFASDFCYRSLEQVKDWFDYFDHVGVKQMITINDHPILRKLFMTYNIHAIEVMKACKGKAFKRGKTHELLITNY